MSFVKSHHPLAAAGKADMMTFCPLDVGTLGRQPFSCQRTQQRELPAFRTEPEALRIDRTGAVLRKKGAFRAEIKIPQPFADLHLAVAAKAAAAAYGLPVFHENSAFALSCAL